MKSLITTSTAATPIGYGNQTHLFRVTKGPFAGRMICVFARTPNDIAWSRSDPPYTEWTAPVDVIFDASDEPCAAMMDDDGNIHIVFTQDVTGALQTIKLVYASGTWAKLTPVTAYDSPTSTNRYPSLLKDAYDRIWVAWVSDDSGAITLRTKKSLDDGLTFGGGAADPGTELASASTSVHACLESRVTHIHCLYTLDGTSLNHRQIHLDAGLWNSAETLYNGTGLYSDLNTALSSDNTLGIVFAADSMIFLREYDGAMWGALQTVSDSGGLAPVLIYVQATPFIQFLHDLGAAQQQLMVTSRVGGEFVTAQPALSGTGPFDNVLIFDDDAATPFADLTVAAFDDTPGDVLHPESGGLLRDIGDAAYLGLDAKFTTARITLSTPGVGGVVTWEYWDGAGWFAFVPASGSYDFDLSTQLVQLFDDSSVLPPDWGRVIVNGVLRYWIRAVVTTAFTTAPVGSQITAATDIQSITHLA